MPQMILNYPAGVGQRFAAALGEAHALKDTQDPPQSRDATAAECKAWMIGRAIQLIVDIEGRALTKAAVDAVVVPPVDMT